MNERPQQYRVWCPCDYEEYFASEVVATAALEDHDATCPNTPEVEER